MSILSNDLIKKILSRLPVKSLCRFKCVCKSWRFLISHPFFVKLHLSRGRTRLLSDYSFALYSIELERVSSEDDAISLIGVKFPGTMPFLTVMCIGSCHGLLAVYCMQNRAVFVYNPSTQEFKNIKVVHDTGVYLFGFGYIESIDDYKLVKVRASTKDIEVYSLREDSWRSIENDHVLSANCDTVGVSLNGAVHWAFEDVNDLCVIAAFDLAQEKFKILPAPDCKLLPDEFDIFPLGVLRGRLCMASMTDNGFDQIWVMEEYGVKGSWIRFLIPRRFNQLRPVCYLNDTETVLLITEEGLVFWDVEDGILKNVEVGKFYYSPLDHILHYEVVSFMVRDREFDAFTYEESLVPLNYNPDNIAEDSILYKDWFV